MRMRERSSVERMRMALTEKRDMLGDMIEVEEVKQVRKEGLERTRGKTFPAVVLGYEIG